MNVSWKNGILWVLVCVSMVFSGLSFLACPTEENKRPPFFTAAPGLTLATGTSPGQIFCSFTPSTPNEEEVLYNLYVMQGNGLTGDAIIDGSAAIPIERDALGTRYTFTGTPGETYSAVFVASKGEDTIRSGVKSEMARDQPDQSEKGNFTTAPGLTFTTGDELKQIFCNFTAAVPNDGVTYTLYIIQGNVLRRAEIISGGTPVQITSLDQYVFEGTEGEPYSAVFVASKGEDKAYSAVQQAAAMAGLVEATDEEDEERGRNGLRSLGKATGTATTYYVDYGRGSDDNDGKSPLAAWKTLHKVNSVTFDPGDHILLEANNIWNGTATTAQNYTTLMNDPGVGMLYPKGNGSDKNHIVIDLYSLEDTPDGKLKVYYSAARRPVINGGGTPAIGTNRWFPSGAITLYNQHHWRIRNIEVTNTFANPITEPNHWYAAGVRKHLCGILVMGHGDKRNDPLYNGVVDPDKKETFNVTIENCYVHDVQSMHTNNGGGGGFNNGSGLGTTPDTNFKVVGGIIVYGMAHTPNTTGTALASSDRWFGYNGILFEGNIVKRVALEGLRNKHEPDGSGKSSSNVVFRGNYLEDIAGDGIVIDGVRAEGDTNARQNNMNGLVESNMVKDACAAPNFMSANYAAVWAMTCSNTMLQYNEAYGSVYGWNDGEAWDIDNGSDKVVYQYNYSHHNAGGCILFMNSITDGVFRYNISANDGGGTRYMANVVDIGKGVNTGSNSYNTWQNGQATFHYTNGGTTADRNKPLIYNNTFYYGDGLTCGVFGQNTTAAVTKYVRFYNNILLKAGTGTVYLSYGQENAGNPGYIYNPTGFKNNLLYAYNTTTGVADRTKFNNGTAGLNAVVNANNNKWQNPNLQIQTSANIDTLRAQRDSAFPVAEYANSGKLNVFTGKARLRARAGIFTPNEGSPVIGAGMDIPKGASPGEVDGGWNNIDVLTEDMFGTEFTTPPIGAAAGTYTGTADPYP